MTTSPVPHASQATPAPRAPNPVARPHRVITALVLREMVTTYGRSPGGWLWALIEPVAAIALLAFAFSLIFRDPPLGRDFALFYATGFLPYMLFHDLSAKIAGALRFSKPLFTFGRVRFLDALIARTLLNTLTHVAVSAIVLTALVTTSRTGALPDPGPIALAYALALALALGVGTLNCYLFAAFPAWERVWGIAMRPLFIVSGVVFLLEDVPDAYQPFLIANPLFHVTGLMRAGMYPNYDPLYPSVAYVLVLAAGLTLLGLLLLDRFADEIIQK